jgi:hypothetical protein
MAGLDDRTLDVNDPVAIRLRVEMAQLHSQTKWLTSRPEESSSDSSDNDSDASGLGGAPTELGHLAEDVKTHIDCLTELSNALEFPAEDPEDDDDEPSALRVEQRTAHGYYADLILAKFPKAQIELAESLGKISWDRYQRMQQEREYNSSANAVSSIQEQHVGEAATKSRFADSEFQDSGLGTSLQVPSVSATRYAETIISYMTSMTGGKRVQIPPLSAEAKAGAKFECNACSKYICAETNREWRYVSRCPTQLFIFTRTGNTFTSTYNRTRASTRAARSVLCHLQTASFGAIISNYTINSGRHGRASHARCVWRQLSLGRATL